MSHPYVTRLNVQYKPLEVIEERQLSDACPYPWYKGVVIPKGVMHRPRAPQRTVMLMVETNGIVPAGD